MVVSSTIKKNIVSSAGRHSVRHVQDPTDTALLSALNIRQLPVPALCPAPLHVTLSIFIPIIRIPALHGPLLPRLPSSIALLLEWPPASSDGNWSNLALVPHAKVGAKDHRHNEYGHDRDTNCDSEPIKIRVRPGEL